jgi:hypothetical protein
MSYTQSLELASPKHEFDCWVARESGRGYAVAQFFYQHDLDGIPAYDAEANARLYIAAPELLEACQLLVRAEQAVSDGLNYKLLVQATDAAELALAKAQPAPTQEAKQEEPA